MRPNCHVPEYRAINRGSPPSGTISGGSERNDGAANARAVPNSAAMAKIGTAEVGSAAAYRQNSTDVSTSTATAMAATRRRSKRSAADPVSGSSTSAGRNSTSPSRPSASSLSVMSYSCLPRAAACNVVADRRRGRREEEREDGPIADELAPARRGRRRSRGRVHRPATVAPRATPGAMTSLADETRWMDAVDQAALVAKGEVTPIELLDAAIARIEDDRPGAQRPDHHVVRPRPPSWPPTRLSPTARSGASRSCSRTSTRRSPARRCRTATSPSRTPAWSTPPTRRSSPATAPPGW